MEYLDLIVGFAVYSLVTVGTPGPNNIMIAASGANFGFRRSIAHIAGIGFGFSFMQAVVGLGMGQVFDLYPIIHDVLRYVGAAFLIYLAFNIAISSHDATKKKTGGKPLSFFQAALFQWVNPKAWVMITGAIASFLTIGGNKFVEISIMVIMGLIIGLPIISLWCLFGREIGRLLKSEKAFKIFNYTMATLLMMTVIMLFL